jgi:DNA-binding response OmpR family regulator
LAGRRLADAGPLAATHLVLTAIRATTRVDGKPFSYPELRARVEALLRRADVRRRPGRLRVGELEVDAAARVVRLRGTPIELSQKEFALVRTLASDPTRVFTKDELLRTIWGFRTLGSNRCIAPYRRPRASCESKTTVRR